jgi:hypothetical protein
MGLMTSERVDKQWKTKGLKGYSTGAILGTLGHYGVTLDEASFTAAAKDKTPLEVATSWRDQWKGKGQFEAYPYAAVEELLNRLLPDQLTPMTFAVALVEVIARAAQALSGKTEGLNEAFDTCEKKVALLPAGDRRDAFNQELIGFLERFGQLFNDLPKQLALKSQKDIALRFAALQESIFADRAGCVTGLVRALTGERDVVLKELEAKVSSGDLFARVSAIDALYQADGDAVIKAHGCKLFDDAAAENKWGLADTVAHLLANVVRRTSDNAFADEVLPRFNKAHEMVGHHNHGH